jgi:hypothetical protein
VLFTKYYWDEEIKETGGAFSTNGRLEEYVRNFSWKNLKRRDHLADLGVDGRIILNLF